MRRALLLSPALALALSLPGCASSESNSASVRGTYSSNTFWTFRSTGIDITLSSEQSCSGSLTVSSASAGAFSGTFTMGAPCASLSGTIVGGQLDANGAITFDLQAAGGSPVFLSAATGCAVSTGGVFSGAIMGSSLSAQSSSVIVCANAGRIRLEVIAKGTRG
jgi:hypothetical protein